MSEATASSIGRILAEHKEFFDKGTTKDPAFRVTQLQKLKDAIRRYEPQIIEALRKDLHKSEFEAYATEIGFTLESISYMMKHLRRWAKPARVKSPLHMFPSKSLILSEPYGTVLIIGPFNYPFQLLIEPLIGALAAGNCAVLKPSESTPAVAAVIEDMIRETFEPGYVRVIQGEKETTNLLIHAKFDYIFFTGSVPVGKIVMEAAAKQLVPVTLELGGKSPVIVDQSANLETAAKRIVWGKLINAGQTCIAPDYLLVHRSVAAKLISLMKQQITAFYGEDALKNPDYGRIVNERQHQRIAGMIEKDRSKVIMGGAADAGELYIEPTLIYPAVWSDASMEDEIFGPVLPILEYESLEEAISDIKERPKPLALYLFTEDKQAEQKVLDNVSFGGGCVNDTISHVASSRLPFGGVGNSGIGGYHGKHSFDLFSHRKSVVKRSAKIDPGIVYPPYGNKVSLVRRLLK
ncbi:aldehyde dehydrogenase [Paenibacillus sp. FSL R7-0273]|uniref:aldehyde dehydrogenase n=1 Tax=Paenibacillus sp. FSL R7-0273 TaxID=1536772 RepID=UPI0004F6527B|nr:aldehyde dehydrogenase [Paenibacillus sp. FSL R7-0273]AIQ49876.1 aldehyde dehydrogenase [Paenibacillus sp. FSL R7-0273]OMF85556.1 aldehyde dehydrogenase [Paenibacillus sp. FSL R7-0273]